MAISIPDKETISKIVGHIEDAENVLLKVSVHSNNSLDNIPSQIKSNISGDYSNLITELTQLQKDCDYAIEGINKCANAYMGLDTDKRVASSGFTLGSPSFVSNSSGKLIRTDKNFFVNLANKGRGNYNDTTGIYSITSGDKKYEYDVNNGRFWINGKKSEVVFGIYAPEVINNHCNMNTITFLHGDGKDSEVNRFDPNNDLIKWSITEDIDGDNIPPDTIMIFPQANTSQHRGNGFYPYSEDVVSGTDFVKTILDQDPNKSQNNMVAFSAGVKSGLKIVATDGKDTYDTFVGINGYAGYTGATEITADDVKVLNQKKIIFWSSQGDASDQSQNGYAWQNRTKSIEHMSKVGLEAEFHTNNKAYKTKLEASGFTKIDFMNDKPNFYGHGNGCKNAIKELNVLHCFE